MTRYILKYPPESVESPVLAEIILETKAKINILKAEADYNKAVMIVKIDGGKKKESEVVNLFRKRGIDVSKITRGITNDVKKCVDCGACIAICPTSAISFGKRWEIKIDKDNCIRCGACVEVCPLRAISIEE